MLVFFARPGGPSAIHLPSICQLTRQPAGKWPCNLTDDPQVASKVAPPRLGGLALVVGSNKILHLIPAKRPRKVCLLKMRGQDIGLEPVVMQAGLWERRYICAGDDVRSRACYSAFLDLLLALQRPSKP